MTNCIYQLWDGEMPQGEVAGMQEMRDYAWRIGVDYVFAKERCYFHNLPPAYGRFRILHDPIFKHYDAIAYADTDVWPVEGLRDSIFDALPPDADLGICTEPLQPLFRQAAQRGICMAADEAWAKRVQEVYGVDMPRNEQGMLKVYNSGLQMWSAAGRAKALERFAPFNHYRKSLQHLGLHSLYTSDQHYLHAMMFAAELNFVELDNDWNRYVHFQPFPEVSDQRTPTTKMVHVQLRSAGNWDGDKLRRVVNRPQEEWNL